MGRPNRCNALRHLSDSNGQEAADAIEAMRVQVYDAIYNCEVRLYNLGMSEEASERIARREGTKKAASYDGEDE